jgi:hypothetical protein
MPRVGPRARVRARGILPLGGCCPPGAGPDARAHREGEGVGKLDANLSAADDHGA